jgi:hypothetical protein
VGKSAEILGLIRLVEDFPHIRGQLSVVPGVPQPNGKLLLAYVRSGSRRLAKSTSLEATNNADLAGVSAMGRILPRLQLPSAAVREPSSLVFACATDHFTARARPRTSRVQERLIKTPRSRACDVVPLAAERLPRRTDAARLALCKRA